MANGYKTYVLDLNGAFKTKHRPITIRARTMDGLRRQIMANKAIRKNGFCIVYKNSMADDNFIAEVCYDDPGWRWGATLFYKRIYSSGKLGPTV